jgi:hypothetical protein
MCFLVIWLVSVLDNFSNNEEVEKPQAIPTPTDRDVLQGLLGNLIAL